IGNYGDIEAILVAKKFGNCECILLYVLEAAVVWKSGEQVKVEEIQVDPPKATKVRIKMICASLCHTDISVCNGFPLASIAYKRANSFPECSTIESVTKVKEGDVVMPLYLGECGECLNCKSGKTNLCLTYPKRFSGLMPDGTSRMSIGGEKIYHHFNCSTWSEYIVIDSNYAVKVDPRMALPHASFLACGFTTGYGAAWKEVDLKKDSTVAVLGLGAVELGKIQLDELLTHEVSFHEINKAFAHFKQPDCVKVLIKF
ncbi:hypothetical protein RJ639_039134, partial [Escallonia herrerae]